MNADAEMPDPVVLVTGGARRIGAAIVEDMSASGFNVVFQYASSDGEAKALLERLNGTAGGKVHAIETDLTTDGAADALFAEAQARFGRIDILVNNASIFADDSARDFDAAVWDNHFALHLRVPAILASHMAAQSQDRDRLIVNIIDQRVWKLTPRFFSYTLSKSALWTATRTMAQSFAPTIRVNAIGPGPTLPNERQDEDDFRRQVDTVPLRRGPDLSEFGDTIRYLFRNKSITGQMIALDGGQHLAWETPDVTQAGE